MAYINGKHDFAIQLVTAIGGGSGGAELNIAYGDTPPEDTSKLWVKTSEPKGVILSNKTPNGSSVPTDESTTYGGVESNHLYTSAATVGGSVYVFCPRKTSSSTSYDTLDTKIYKYTGTSGTLLSTTMPSPRDRCACVAVGNNIYILGGNSVSKGSAPQPTIYCFDTETETVETLTTQIPVGLMNVWGVSVGTKIYLFGGYDSSSNQIDTIYCFDTETETIDTLSTKLPQVTQCIRGAAVGTKIYLFGGHNAYVGAMDSILCFDTETETIDTLSTKLPQVMHSMGCCSIGTNIILYGGCPANNITNGNYDGEIRAAYLFDTTTNTLRKLSMTPSYPLYTIVVPFPNNDSYVWVVAGTTNTKTSSNDYGNPTTSKLRIKPASAFDLESNVLFIRSLTASSTVSCWSAVNDENIKIEINPQSVSKGNADGLSQWVEAALYKDGAWTPI